MPKPFHPKQPEVFVSVEITKREWNMVRIIRSIPYGKIEIDKVNNQLVRIEPRTSIILDDDMNIK